MALTYLKIEPEQAVTSLNEFIVSGYKLKDKLVLEYLKLRQSDTPGSFKRTIPPEASESLTTQFENWATKIFDKLQEIYISEAEAYKFKEVQVLLPLRNTAFDDHFFRQLLIAQTRIDILNSYKDFIFQHSNIQIIAGRDVTIQNGGSHNIQEVNNEG